MRKLGFLVSALCMGHFAMAAHAEMIAPIGFSADLVEVDGEPRTIGRLYAGPEGIRLENLAKDYGSTLVASFERELIWQIRDGGVETQLHSFWSTIASFGFGKCPMHMTEEFVGEGRLQGRLVATYRCSDPSELTDSVRVWFDPELRFRIRQEGTITTELRNIEIGDVDNALFQEPDGAMSAEQVFGQVGPEDDLGTRALTIARGATRDVDVELAAALALESWRRDPGPASHRAASHAFDSLPSLRVEHDGDVISVAFSPDGGLMATGDGDGIARLIQTSDGVETARVEHGDQVRSVVFNHDVQLLATASQDGTARLIHVDDGRELARFEHDDWVIDVALSPDGRFLATATNYGVARLIRVADGGLIAEVQHGAMFGTEDHAGWITGLTFSPDSRFLATGSEDGTARVIRADDGSEATRVEHEGSVTSVAFSPDGSVLASGGRDGTARLTRTSDGAEVDRFHTADAEIVAFSPDGSRLAIGGRGDSVRLIRLADGSEVLLAEHGGWVGSLAFNPDGGLLVTGGADGITRVFRTDDGHEIARIPHGGVVWSVSVSPVGNLVATGSADGNLRLFRLLDGTEVAGTEHSDRIRQLAFTPDGNLLSSGGWPDTTIARAGDGIEFAPLQLGTDVAAMILSADGNLIATAEIDGAIRVITAEGSEVFRTETDDWVDGFAFDNAEDLLAIGERNGRVRIIRISDGMELVQVEHGAEAKPLAFSPDGTLLATASLRQDHLDFIDGADTLRLLRTSDGREVARTDIEGRVMSFAVSPDASLLAIGSNFNSAHLINAADGREVTSFPHQGVVWSLAFSPDGSVLATGSGGGPGLWQAPGTTRLIRLADGSDIASIGHDQPVSSVAFSPDGGLIAAGSWDGTARLIRTADGRELGRLEHADGVGVVAFSPDGNLLATGGWDGRARLWLTPDALMEKLCAERAGRNLRQADWERHIGPIETWEPTCLGWRSDPQLRAAWQVRAEGDQGEATASEPIQDEVTRIITPNESRDGLLFVASRGPIAVYYYGFGEGEDKDITHLTVTRNGAFIGSIFFDERGAPVHWMLPNQTFAMRSIGNPRSRKIMACNEGMTSLTFNLEELLEGYLLETLINWGNILDQAEAVTGVLSPERLEDLQDMRRNLEFYKKTVDRLNWGNKTHLETLSLARTRGEHSVARGVASLRVAISILKRFPVPVPEVLDVAERASTYLSDILDGKYEGHDIEGPKVPMLLCAGQSMIPNVCNYFYLHHTPGNLMKCLNVCHVTLRCFTGICHPTFLSVEEVLNFRARN